MRNGADNPTIVDMARVKCPAELVELTQIERADDPETYEIEEENRPEPYQGGNSIRLLGHPKFGLGTHMLSVVWSRPTDQVDLEPIEHSL